MNVDYVQGRLILTFSLTARFLICGTGDCATIERVFSLELGLSPYRMYTAKIRKVMIKQFLYLVMKIGRNMCICICIEICTSICAGKC